MFGENIGLSDHSPKINSAILVALGAKVIEKHFTLDKYDWTRSLNKFKSKRIYKND